MTWRGELPKSEQGYVFVLEETPAARWRHLRH
jgi:arginine/ornithine N-succinyltransferase beta subunit